MLPGTPASGGDLGEGVTDWNVLILEGAAIAL